MNWITRYAAYLMFVLFAILASAVAAAALPKLIIPLLAAGAVVAAMMFLSRIGR